MNVPRMLFCLALTPLPGLAAAQAGAPRADVPVLTVTTAADPVEKSYRRIVRGMDLFERKRAMAPGASLRFRLLPRRNDTDMSRVSLEIVGETVDVPVPVAPDNTFVLERIAKAWEEDASVQANRKTLTLTWRAEIRSAGVPPGKRRLGDLRLECEVGMESGLVSNVPSAPGPGHCSESKPRYFFFAERPLFRVSLVSGTRRQTLPMHMLYANALEHPMSKRDLARCDCEVLLDRAYYLPLGDASWPDDTLVEYETMDERPSAEMAPVPDPAARKAFEAVRAGSSTKAEVRAALGPAAALRFENGFEIWAYRFQDPAVPSHRPMESELAILFAPSGRASKTRLAPG